MNRAWHALAGAGAIIMALVTGGCTQPTPEELSRSLSYAILVPERTCAELRDAFELDYLPLADHPDQIGLNYEEAMVATARGAALRVWYIPAAADRGTVIVSPGAVASMPCYLFIAMLLNQNGWSVVMYDYQGFGGSTSTPELNSLPADLRAVLDWTLKHTGRTQVTLFSMSLGSIPSVAIAIERPEAVNGVVLDSPVALGEEFKRFDVPLGDRFEALMSVLDPVLFSENIIDQMTQPLLVYINDEDYVTPPETIELLYDRAAGPKEVVHFTGLEHAQAQFRDTDEYLAHLESFLETLWSPSAAVETP